jgi:predicted dinucleotide-binding enzyme
MKIGVIGAGNIGAALAKHFCRLGHAVVIANSRGPSTLVHVAQQTGALPVDLSEVARDVDLMVISVPMRAVPALPKQLFSGLHSISPVIDTGNYYPRRDGIIAQLAGGMTESEWTSHIIGRPVIKVFNNIIADSLLYKGQAAGSAQRIALPVSGEDVPSKQRVIALLDEIGFDGFDAGSLSESWRHQPGTPAYCSDPTIRELPSLLRNAVREKAAKNRDQAARLMARVSPDFPPQELVRIARLSAGLDTWRPRSWLAALHLGFAALCR